MATNAVDEVLKEPLSKYSELFHFILTKVFIVLFGFIVPCLSFVSVNIEGSVAQKVITVVGAFGSPVTGAFLLGAVCSKANKYGAISGGLASIAVNLWIVIGMHLHGRKTKPLPGPPSDQCFLNTTIYNELVLANTTSTTINYTTQTSTGDDIYGFTFFMYDISYVWYSVIGVLVTFFVGLAVSLCTRQYDVSKPNPLLIFYVFREVRVKANEAEVKEKKAESTTVTYKFKDSVTKTKYIKADNDSSKCHVASLA